jgi:hypothetical protein
LLSFRTAASLKEEDEDGESVVSEQDKVADPSADQHTARVGRDATQTQSVQSEKARPGKQEERPEKRARCHGNEEDPADKTAPARFASALRQSSNDATKDDIASISTDQAVLTDQETARIPTPHPHDVLFGRGDAIHDHAGNVQYRVWLSERKESYHLAPRDRKKDIMTAVIDLVREQNPPGRFLKRDPTHAGWWIEAGDAAVTDTTRNKLWRRYDKNTTEEIERSEKRVRCRGNGEAQSSIDRLVPFRLDDLCNDRVGTEDDIASVGSQETVRIRTPHRHDVLFGRGDAIFHHAGNVQFREWVSERKTMYRLAPNDMKKKSIIREVIALVQNQHPPGLFLQRDPDHVGWWIEADDCKALKKAQEALYDCRGLLEVEGSEPKREE